MRRRWRLKFLLRNSRMKTWSDELLRPEPFTSAIDHLSKSNIYNEQICCISRLNNESVCTVRYNLRSGSSIIGSNNRQSRRGRFDQHNNNIIIHGEKDGHVCQLKIVVQLRWLLESGKAKDVLRIQNFYTHPSSLEAYIVLGKALGSVLGFNAIEYPAVRIRNLPLKIGIANNHNGTTTRLTSSQTSQSAI